MNDAQQAAARLRADAYAERTRWHLPEEYGPTGTAGGGWSLRYQDGSVIVVATHPGPVSQPGPPPVPRITVFEWDYREQPPMHEIAAAAAAGLTYMTEAQTGTDQYAWVLSDAPVSVAAATMAYGRHAGVVTAAEYDRFVSGQHDDDPEGGPAPG
jgi:hypothetical protein